MKNILSRYLLNNDIVISASDTTELAEYAHQIHETYPTATAALGRTLTGAVMMASGLKGKDQNLTISINGGWPKGEFKRVGIAVCGTDDNGAALAFYSMIEF